MPVSFGEDAEQGSRGEPEVHIATDAEDSSIRASTKADTSQSGRQAKKHKAAAAVNLRRWLRIDAHGESYITGSATLKLAHRLGIQPRDLRFLELQSASYSPTALLARESAIVVCFESIRCILTLSYILGT